MQVVFTIGSGAGNDHELVERLSCNLQVAGGDHFVFEDWMLRKFLQRANDELGWLDIRSHPLGTPSDAIRVALLFQAL